MLELIYALQFPRSLAGFEYIPWVRYHDQHRYNRKGLLGPTALPLDYQTYRGITLPKVYALAEERRRPYEEL